jgi:2,4-dienoyl-CoA reductase-like NADH-dependent reductase (Old Yellow Enzyme family)/thioredoxin reductase
MKYEFPNLFKPITIGSMKLKNRVVLAPMGTGLGNKDDTLSERLISFYTTIAQGGTSLITTGVAAVSKDGTVGMGMNSLYDDKYIPGFRSLADAIHSAGGKLSVHLMHGGLEAYPFFTKKKRLISPSGGIFEPNQMRFKGMDLDKTLMISNAMTLEDIKTTGDDFAAAALRAKQAGADAVELNGAQGFLLQQFYSPYFNKRTDEYGGDFEGRMRFALEVVNKVRAAVDHDFPIIFRMVATEGNGGGIDVEDAIKIARILENSGVNALHVTAGRGISPAYWSLMMPIAEEGHTPIIDHVATIKKAVSIPVIGVQRIVDPESAENILENNKCDMVALGRGLIADPNWVNKAREGRTDDIRKCIGCLQGCIGTQMTAGFANCLQNPEAGRKKNMRLKPSTTPRKVLVVGGGPAGLEAALVAGQRGHKVVLCEKNDRLGGQWNLAHVPPGKEDFRWVIDWRINQIRKLDNVTVKTGCEIDAKTIDQLAPDVTVVATGSVPTIPDIPGAQGDRIVTAHAVLGGEDIQGQAVAIIGGGATGCETAHFLADNGKNVTIVEALPDIATDEMPARKVWLVQNLIRKNVTIATNTQIKEITDAGELLAIRGDQTENLGTFDAIVMATGVRTHDPLGAMAGKLEGETYVVGDAFVMATNGLDALHHASEIARQI